MRRFWTVALVLACSVAALAGTAEDLAKFVPEADMIKILAAIPDAATAKPAATRKLLILTESAQSLAAAEKNAGVKFVPHPSAPHCALAIAEMGKKTGAFTATIATDAKIITADGLAPFDAIVLANVYLGGKLYLIPRDFTTEPKPAFQAQQKALLDFVKNGKGIVGIHNTTAEALGWPEYNTMIGAVHSGIAWYVNQATPIKLDDPKHPLNTAFAGKGFTVQDDVSSFATPYSRESLHVLLSVDTGAAPETLNTDRPDGDYPVSWIKPYGTGRVFHTSLGHAPATFQNAPFLKHVLDGVQFALGDLKADASPGTPLPAKPDFAFMKGWTPLFDGSNLDAWSANEGQKKHWIVENGILRYDGRAGTLRSKQSFKNYKLRVDFRLPREADSGVFVRDNKQLNIWTWKMGSGEMWEHRGGFKDKTKPNPYVPKSCEDRPVGEWNSFLVTVQDDKVTVLLNGVEVISQVPLLGAKPESPIGLQQHGDPLEYKNIYITRLPEAI